MTKKIGEIFASRNYDQFHFIGGNRQIDRGNVDKIKESMQEEQLIIPVIVNENYGIVDGQHRFTACKELGFPVYYTVQEGYGISQVLRANQGSKKWVNEDFLYQHIQLNNENYIDFRNLCQLYNISVSDMMKLFCTIQDEKMSIFKQNFRNGAFVMDHKEDATKFLNALSKFNTDTFHKHYTKSSFVSAFMKLYFRQDYSQDVMNAKLDTNGYQLRQCSTSNDYLSMLCNDVYSYGSKKDCIYFSSETGRFFKKGK